MAATRNLDEMENGIRTRRHRLTPLFLPLFNEKERELVRSQV